ncbi:MAG: hypothetical protein WBG76_00240, partial [Ornithinimicrobium sp.]
MSLCLQFLDDAQEFLTIAGEHLSQDPVQNTVVATMAQRLAAGEVGAADHWWLVVHDDGELVGAAMRTAPFPPRPAFLLPMPEEAAELLARTLYDREEVVLGMNGALPAVRVCAEEMARLTGGATEVVLHTRLFKIHQVVSPTPPKGRLRLAVPGDCELAMAWFAAFMADADEQAGRTPGSSPHESPSRDGMMRRIESECLWLWVD